MISRFISSVNTCKGDESVVEAIIALAHRLDIRVVGEGVETEDQLNFIRARGCDLAQGHYFAVPLSPPKFEEWQRSFSLPIQLRSLTGT
ncbi:MAG: EAL domain-containing protein [Rhodospirillales bacterium]|nr:EAL domain-containing protein [Rhodospirillales bacterium]